MSEDINTIESAIKEIEDSIELNLFSAVVENKYLDESEIKQAMKLFMEYISENIFSGLYWLLYEMIKKLSRLDIIITKDQFINTLKVSCDKLISSKIINLEEYSISDYIEDQKRDLFNYANLLFDKLYNKPITFEKFKSYLRQFIESKKIELYKQAIIEAYKKLNLGASYEDIEQLTNDIKRDLMKSFVKIDKSIVTSNSDNILISDEFSTVLDNILFSNDTTNKTPVTKFNIRKIDEVFNPLSRGRLLCLVGASGSGKTRNLVNLIYNACKKGYNSLIISLEGSKEDFFAMLMARYLIENGIYNGNKIISSTDILTGKLPDELKELIKLKWMEFVSKSGKVCVVGGPLYVEDLTSKLLSYYENVLDYQIVAIDHMSLISSRSKLSLTDTLREAYKEFESFVRHGIQGGVLGIALHQMSTDAIQKLAKEGDLDVIDKISADSSYAMKSSDMVLGIFQDKKMKEDKTIKYICLKNRYGRYFPTFNAYEFHEACVYYGEEEVN